MPLNCDLNSEPLNKFDAAWWPDIKIFYKKYLGLFLMPYNFAFMHLVDLRSLIGLMALFVQEEEEQQEVRGRLVDLPFAGKKLS